MTHCARSQVRQWCHAHLSYIHSASSLVFSGSIGFRCCGVLRLFCFHNPARPSASFSGTEGRVPGRPLPDIVASCNCIRFDWPGGPPALRAWLITLVAMFGIIIWTGWVCLRAVRCVVNQLSAVQSHPHHQPPSPRTPTTTTPCHTHHHLPVRPQLSPQRTHARLCTHAEVVYRRIHTDESRLLYITFLTLSKWRRSYDISAFKTEFIRSEVKVWLTVHGMSVTLHVSKRFVIMKLNEPRRWKLARHNNSSQ